MAASNSTFTCIYIGRLQHTRLLYADNALVKAIIRLLCAQKAEIFLYHRDKTVLAYCLFQYTLSPRRIIVAPNKIILWKIAVFRLYLVNSSGRSNITDRQILHPIRSSVYPSFMINTARTKDLSRGIPNVFFPYVIIFCVPLQATVF
jgi:hypothetical protein